MPWVRIDETLPRHPKFLCVGVGGIGLFIVGVCYANEYLTDGFVPLAAVSTVNGEDMTSLIETLVTTGVWTHTEHGLQIHDFHQYQPTKKKVLRERKQAKRRKAKWLKTARGTQKERQKNGVVNANPDPTRPDPDPCTYKERSRGRV